MLKRLYGSGLWWLWLTALVLVLDQATKEWVLQNLSLFEPLRLLPILNFTLAYNTGAAFSFLHTASGWQNIFFGAAAVSTSVIILIWLSRISRNEWWLSMALCFILAGAIGNAWDRVLHHHVIDFIDFHFHRWHFAIFNLADAGISVGAFLLIVHWFIFPKKERY